MKITEIPTPALIIEESVFMTNLKTMADMAGDKLRPHYKSHKCGEIARMQLDAGAKGMTCATLKEAEDLVRIGCRDILFANQVADMSKAERLADIAKQTRLTVCAEKREDIGLYSAAAKKHGVTIGVYAEYNTGMNRMGVNTIEETLELAQLIGNTDGLRFDGVQAYAGQLSHIVSTEERRDGAEKLQDRMRELKKLFAGHGIVDFEISGASTGTAAFKLEGGVYTELQCGSYLCGDNNYGLCGLPFGQSLFVLTTILGVHGNRVITDAGVKSTAVDQGMPTLIADTAVVSLELHEEHGLIEFAESPNLGFGDRVRYIPGHCCATMNQHDWVYFVDGGEVTRVVEVSARGY